eukprot:scaffold1596_cov302-Pinguiococcus_pyrenoidosus.AAC.78
MSDALEQADAETQSAHKEYLKEHPELRELLNEFTTACLVDRPENIFAFAEQFFTGVVERKKASRRPVVICGPSGVGKGTLIGRIMVRFSFRHLCQNSKALVRALKLRAESGADV